MKPASPQASRRAVAGVQVVPMGYQFVLREIRAYDFAISCSSRR
jgi:hypothetical protein